jgi:hypothetical protein
MKKICLFLSCISLYGCVLPPLQCLLEVSDINQKYVFNFSKKELKQKIVDTYTYDNNLWIKNFGKTMVFENGIDELYSKRQIWLDEDNWNDFKSEISQNVQDTLNIRLFKWQSRKEFRLNIIVDGDEKSSSITIKKINYERLKACVKNPNEYKMEAIKVAERKFIKKIK